MGSDKKMTDDELKDRAQEQDEEFGGPQEGDIYRHYKGGLYTIKCRAIREDTLEPVVVYRSNRKKKNWARTVENFTQLVKVGDQMVPRFSSVDG